MNTYKTCAFTGHRNLNYPDYDPELLDRVVLNLIKNGCERFLCGMAMGFDLDAAQTVTKYKKQYGVKLVACVPCPGQADKFPVKVRKLYGSIINQCDEVEVLSDSYYDGCMLSRNRYMIDNCDVLVSFLRKNRGGTYYTVNYARQKDIKIIEI